MRLRRLTHRRSCWGIALTAAALGIASSTLAAVGIYRQTEVSRRDAYWRVYSDVMSDLAGIEAKTESVDR